MLQAGKASAVKLPQPFISASMQPTCTYAGVNASAVVQPVDHGSMVPFISSKGGNYKVSKGLHIFLT